jgi:parallel beta-helix repeat protein
MNTANGNDFGIYLISSNKNDLNGNTVSGNTDGIRLAYSEYNKITNNNASGNTDGIWLEYSNYNNLSGNNADDNSGAGIYLWGYNDHNNLTGNTARGNGGVGIGLLLSSYNTLSSNDVSGNTQNGTYLDSSSNNDLNGNHLSGNTQYGISLMYGSSTNTIYNNYFNNNANVFIDSESTGNTWNVTPTAGPNIVGGPYIGGNYWAQPDGQGWSQNHTDIGNGFAEPYHITAPYGSTSQVFGNGVIHTNNIDYHPLVLPTPVPTPVPGPSGGVTPVVDLISPALPWDSTFTGNTIPGTMQPCHSYSVSLTVKNTGTVNWSSANGVRLVPSSSNGFTFDPAQCPIPEGVVVHPGDSYSFPVTINVPCPMANGTYQLRFRLVNTVQTKSGPVEVTFGEVLVDNVNIGTATVASSEVKAGVKTIAPQIPLAGNTMSTSARSFTTIIPGPVSGSPASTTIARNFYPLTAFWWSSLQPAE